MMNLTVKELKGLAKEAGIKGYSKMKKAELIAVLENNKSNNKGEETMTTVNNNNTKEENKSNNKGEKKMDQLFNLIAEGNVAGIVEFVKNRQNKKTRNP